MSLPRKSSVKRHLSARERGGNGPFQPASESTAVTVIEAEVVEINVDTETFVEDFMGEHSPSGHGLPSNPPL